MTRPRHIGSRLLVAIAVLMLGKPPCVGATCCGMDEARSVASAPIEAPASETGSCCAAKLKGAKVPTTALPSLSCDTQAEDDCPCCRPAPNAPATRTESRTISTDDQAPVEALLPPPLLHANPERRSPLPHGKPSPHGVALYLRLAHLRN